MGGRREENAERGFSRTELRQFLKKKLVEGAVDEVVDEMLSILDRLQNAHLRDLWRLKQELKRRFGRRSEKISEDQLQLVFEAFLGHVQHRATPPDEDASPENQPEVQLDEAQPRDPERRKERRKPKRKALPADLPREEVVIAVAEGEVACPTCQGEREVIGYEESEVLEYTPPQLRVRRIRREKRGCRRCQNAVVTAPAAPKVVERGAVGAGLAAQVLVAKFRDHLPLYRQQQIYKRWGVSLPRSTLGDWVAGTTQLLEPVARRIGERALGAAMLQTDDTGLRVLDRDREAGVKRGALWLYVGDGAWAWFHYTPSRSAKGPLEVLGSREGYLQADGYPGYQPLYESGRCIEVGCWAHARRYFVRALESDDLRAAVPLGHIAQLYRIEAQAKEAGAGADERKQRRQAGAVPVLTELHGWLEEWRDRVPPKLPLGEAIHYALPRWGALTRYLEDGRLDIDNNRVERLVRIVAVGRRNYLFAGSDAGAERAATAYTVLATCALHEIEPWAYVKDVLEKIAAGWPQREIDALLPDRWLEQHPDAVRCPAPA